MKLGVVIESECEQMMLQSAHKWMRKNTDPFCLCESFRSFFWVNIMVRYSFRGIHLI